MRSNLSNNSQNVIKEEEERDFQNLKSETIMSRVTIPEEVESEEEAKDLNESLLV